MSARKNFIVSEKTKKPHFESQLLEAHVKLRVMSRGKDGSVTTSLARHGAYEVRLYEPPQDVGLSGDVLFRIELFNHSTRTVVEGYSCNLVEDAATALARMIDRANQLADGEASS
jgi:hypothetical protein